MAMIKTCKMPDLQTKSASGAVATFNTALAMPLASCSIAVNAWQEGSGDPSPSNVRAIHGFSEVNATRCGINLWDEEYEKGGFSFASGVLTNQTDRIRNKNLIKVTPQTNYYIKAPERAAIGYYAKDGSYLGYNDNYNNKAFTTRANCEYIRFFCMVTSYSNNISINYPSIDTDYHAYTGNTYTIQLGQEVYGAEVDAGNGVAHCTWKKKVITDVINWSFFSQFKMAYRTSYLSDNPPEDTDVSNIMCENLKAINQSERGSNIGNFIYLTSNGLSISAPDCESLEDYESWIANNPVTFIYKLAEPFDIQLTPTQIETLIGNNTIFADTGDVDLTFKDLDIAKRGNFREVFKLP